MILETPRLLLREFTLEDSDFIIELLNTEGWLKFIGDRGVRTKQDAERYLVNGPFKSYVENGFGLSMIVLKENNSGIGMCGLIRRDTLPDVDIGFALLPQYAGNGYAAEIATSTLLYGQTKLGINRIVAITNPENFSSVKLLNRIGLKFEKTILYEGKEELLLFACNFAT